MADKIRVLHVIKSLGRGGAEMLLPECLRLHDRERFEFHYIYFLPWKNQMVSSIEENGGVVNCFSAGSNATLMLKIWKLRDYIRAKKIDVVHAHLPWAGILARVVGTLTPTPLIYTEHNKQERYHPLTRFVNLLTMNLTTEVIAVSEDVANSLRTNKPNLTIPVKTILNGVDTNHFSAKSFQGEFVREKLGIPIGASVVGTVAVFRTQKRLDLWLEVAAKILRSHHNVHFILVGDGPLKQALVEKCQNLGIENRIHMPGLETEVRPYLASMDVYLMTSQFEGLPLALLEAMSMECPIVTTDAGGVKEVVRHQIEGLVCRVGESELLSEHVLALLRDRTLRGQYGRQANERVQSQFSLEKMVRDLEQQYVMYANIKRR